MQNKHRQNSRDSHRNLVLHEISHRLGACRLGCQHGNGTRRSIGKDERRCDCRRRCDGTYAHAQKERKDGNRKQRAEAGGGRHHQAKEMSQKEHRTENHIRCGKLGQGLRAESNKLVRSTDLVHVGGKAARHQDDEAGGGNLRARERTQEFKKIKADPARGLCAARKNVVNAGQNGQQIQSKPGEK